MRKHQRQNLLQGISVASLLFALLVWWTSSHASQTLSLSPRESSPVPPQWDDSTQYLIPQLSGLGLNNQLWDYTAAAALAKATDRVLCLVPFLRFYLSKEGRPRIPYEELFDPDVLNEYTRVREMKGCALACASVLDRFYSFQSDVFETKTGKEQTHLKAFRQSTKFRANLPENPIFINDTTIVEVTSMQELRDNIPSVIDTKDLCVGVVTSSFHLMETENREITKYFVSAPSIQQAASHAIETLFRAEKFVAIHWRFEETKCRGVGSLLPEDRSVPREGFNREEMSKAKGLPIVGTGPLCFFSARNSSRSLVLTSQADIVRAIQKHMQQHDIQRAFLATDVDPGQGKSLLRHLQDKIKHLKLLKDLPSGWAKKVDFKQQDIASRVEQEICSRATRFLGTSTSSWTTTVSDTRQNRGQDVSRDTHLDFIV
mmetsp:Transcript_13894/g.23504  ORF Transcript_13894/g.23504 Transcript_13894/m.23504 type:complete len:430 (+) Transcript_13894:235-1524(+)|eukprot:CAMPEP_0198212030 /NCGR_PEP_ID=MMETSP1445-20131203/25484_1 /TAXON_ID=36898 /ORGANISM="Pyramimonas sp., Strain CCMP2087" /LENGTH=429 /DNA_ID=CAMNT_0043886401 /DNA_START=220 /DNA_END=1509 /DNA_ORIENTATION=+